jgi:hypothetical protein
MPLPAYFICSEGLAVDRDLNKVTLFNVCEQLPIVLVSQLEQAGRMAAPLPFRIISVWMKEENDLPEVNFEHQIVLHFPQTPEMIIAQTPFSFTTTLHRIITTPSVLPGSPGPGILRVEARIRRAGETEWIGHQFFYIDLIVFDLAAIPSLPSSSGT